jgi:hypothetical protein
VIEWQVGYSRPIAGRSGPFNRWESGSIRTLCNQFVCRQQPAAASGLQAATSSHNLWLLC